MCNSTTTSSIRFLGSSFSSNNNNQNKGNVVVRSLFGIAAAAAANDDSIKTRSFLFFTVFSKKYWLHSKEWEIPVCVCFSSVLVILGEWFLWTNGKKVKKNCYREVSIIINYKLRFREFFFSKYFNFFIMVWWFLVNVGKFNYSLLFVNSEFSFIVTWCDSIIIMNIVIIVVWYIDLFSLEKFNFNDHQF